MPIQALIFDFDGLLLDTETPAYTSWNKVYQDYRQSLSLELWREALGRRGGEGFRPLDHLTTLVGEIFNHDEVAEQRWQHKMSLCHAEELRPGVLSLLSEAKELGLSCAVASSSGAGWVLPWLHKHGIFKEFAVIRTGDDMEHVKPAPDVFLSAASGLGLEPGNCLVFEDSPNGIHAAQAAGMPCAAVPCLLEDLPASTLRLRSLNEIPLAQILKGLNHA